MMRDSGQDSSSLKVDKDVNETEKTEVKSETHNATCGVLRPYAMTIRAPKEIQTNKRSI
jgi:hypothetical protein